MAVTLEELLERANGDEDKLIDLMLETGYHVDEGQAALEASVEIRGYGDVIPEGAE